MERYLHLHPSTGRLCRLALVALALLAAFGTAAEAGTTAYLLSAAGSAASVDEQGRNVYSFSGAVASIRTGAPTPSTLPLRFNLARGAAGYDYTFGKVTMTVRFRDNGSSAQALVSVKGMNVGNGAVRTVGSLNSNNFPSETGFQTRTVTLVDCGAVPLNFAGGVYWVEATLAKTGSSGAPAIAGIVVKEDDCDGLSP